MGDLLMARGAAGRPPGRPWEPAAQRADRRRPGDPGVRHAERDAAEAMPGRQPGRDRATLGADKAYDAAGLVAGLRALNVTPHVAQNTSGRRSAIDTRTPRHPGYAASQRVRRRIEEAFGWIKTVGA
jgi:hypothetical protein